MYVCTCNYVYMCICVYGPVAVYNIIHGLNLMVYYDIHVCTCPPTVVFLHADVGYGVVAVVVGQGAVTVRVHAAFLGPHVVGLLGPKPANQHTLEGSLPPSVNHDSL